MSEEQKKEEEDKKADKRLLFYSFGSESTTSDYDFSVYAYQVKNRAGIPDE